MLILFFNCLERHCQATLIWAPEWLPKHHLRFTGSATLHVIMVRTQGRTTSSWRKMIEAIVQYAVRFATINDPICNRA